ncbi:hypothetical protein C8T65DRAFT_743658 [Cerioporus squamosus]|nr:hypothetical protein C8T65DRAFT_743658 [Cerioporus squamosus]
MSGAEDGSSRCDDLGSAPPSPLTDISSDVEHDEQTEEEGVELEGSEEEENDAPGPSNSRGRSSSVRTQMFLARKTGNRPDSLDPTHTVVTAWFEIRSAVAIPEPPHFVKEKCLLGDVFYRRDTLDSRKSQLWIWVPDGRGPRWMPIYVGYRRSDGRLLSLTRKRKNPSWIRQHWFVRLNAEDSS